MILSDDWNRFTHDGREFAAKLERDDSHGAPWDEECGHGDVTGWLLRACLPDAVRLSDYNGNTIGAATLAE